MPWEGVEKIESLESLVSRAKQLYQEVGSSKTKKKQRFKVDKKVIEKNIPTFFRKPLQFLSYF